MQWEKFDLVVFDVDGTLYCQKKLRMLMARDLLISALSTRNFHFIKVLKSYREIRERLGEKEEPDFEQKLVAEVARTSDISVQAVERIVAEWLNTRPLPYLRSCRFKGVPEIFENLRTAGKTIGVLSDYPAHEKLAALGVRADVVVCASDREVNMLKPHPRGLAHVVSLAGASPEKTLMIGDRVERDGYAARRTGAAALIKSSRDIAGWDTFRSYDTLNRATAHD